VLQAVPHPVDGQDVKPRALVCEDDPALLAVVGDLVEAHGWTATTASTATAAIEMATRIHPDLVILDINLVGMSGLESIPRVRLSCPEARVVAMSVNAWGLDLCLGAGACAAVTTADIGRLDELLTGLMAQAAA